MEAIAVIPGKSDSARLIEMADPNPGPGDVLVKVLEVGICGTDWEINDGLYGEAPEGEEVLVLGHESFGQVEAIGPGVEGLAPGDYVVATVRRPDGCRNCQKGEYDMCLTGGYKERGIKGLHGFMARYYVERPEYLVKVPPQHRSVGVLMEPLSIVEKALFQAYQIQKRMVWEPQRALVLGAGPIGLLGTALLLNEGLETYTMATGPKTNPKARLVEEMGANYLTASEDPVPTLKEKLGHLDIILEATGNSTVVFQAMGILGTNGVLCLLGVSGGNKTIDVPADAINLQMVLGNEVVFGTVNANRRYFEMGIEHFGGFQSRWPGLLEKMFTHRFPMSRYQEALAAQKSRDSIKVLLEIGD